MSGSLIIVSAPSGGGKTSLTRALIPNLAQRGIHAEISVSHTTRTPRPGEQEGLHYHFIDDACFTGMIDRGEFLEHAEVFGRRYGTARSRTEALLAQDCNVILDIDWQGARQVKRQCPDAVGVFIFPPSLEELQRRLQARAQDSAAVIAARMSESRSEIAHYREYDYLVVNQNFDQALEQLTAVCVALRLQREAQQSRLTTLLDELERL